MKMHILLVDDEPAILFTLAFVLRTHGYKVSQAGDGLEALQMAENARDQGEPFDLILTDIQMPRMNGIEFIDALKVNGMTVPIFVLTGSRDMELMKRLKNKGCLEILFKPCDFKYLAARVNSILQPEAARFGAKPQAAGLSMELGVTP